MELFATVGFLYLLAFIKLVQLINRVDVDKHESRITKPEWGLILLVFAAHVSSYVVGMMDSEHLFEIWMSEAGLIESLSVSFLILALIGLVRNRVRETPALVIASLVLLILLEELSWGQRIIGFHTPGVIDLYNSQGETTFHNTELGALFTVLFVIIPSLLFLMVLPLIGNRESGMMKVVVYKLETMGFEIPRIVLAYLMIEISAMHILLLSIDFENALEITEMGYALALAAYFNTQFGNSESSKHATRSCLV